MDPAAPAESPTKLWFRPSLTELACLFTAPFLVLIYGWLLDDAYVYFRYVDNLLIHNSGLVWNRGEYVEGFSSPAWMMLLVVTRSLKWNYMFIVRLVGVLSYLVFWWLACLSNRWLSGPKTETSLNLPLVYLSFTYGVLCYFTSGLESPLVLIAAAAFAASIARPRSIVMQGLVGLSPLIRHELALPLILLFAYQTYRTRRPPLVGVATAVLTLGGYLVFRIWYYADFFPNTFYLKDTTWVFQGLLYVFDTALPYQTVPFLIAAGIAFAAMRKRGAESLYSGERALMLICAGSVAAYVVKIGGDPRHFRYLAFPYCLAVLATGGLAERLVTDWKRQRVYGLALTFALGLFAMSNFPRQLNVHPIFGEFTDIPDRGVMHINDAESHRHRAKSPFSPGLTEWGAELSWGAAIHRRKENRGSTKPIQVSPWCNNGYWAAGQPSIIAYGLTDAFLARTEMVEDRPAHKKGLFDLAHNIAGLRNRQGFGLGAFAKTAGRKRTPAWIAQNQPVLAEIEKRVYNDHHFVTNLGLALTRVGKIDPGPQPVD